MGLAIPNEPLKSALLKDGPGDFNNRSEDITLSLFTGVMPTKAQLLAQARYHADGWMYLDTMYTWLTTTYGAVELLQMEWSDFAFREHLTATKFKFNISKRTETFAGKADGTATWFMLSEQDESVPYTGGHARWAVVGTVGLVGSGADFIIPDTNIVTTKTYRGNDITIDFNIAGTIA